MASPGIASRLARFAGRWERDRGTVQGAARSPAGGQRLPGATNVGMAQIPAGVGGQGHGLERQANAADFIAVLVNGRHQAGVGFPRFRRDMRGDAGLRPEVQALEASQGLWKVDSGDSLEGGSERLRRHCRAIVEAGMATGWRWLPMRHPAIQVDQSGTQQRAVIGPVEGLLATVALPRVSILWWKGPDGMLCPAKVVNAHLLRHVQIAATGDIDVHQGTMAAPVLR